MIFLGWLLYLVAMPSFFFLMMPVMDAIRGLPILVWCPALLLLCVSLSAFLIYLVDVYDPDRKLFFRNLIRLPGVRWLAAMTALAAVVFLLVESLWFRESPGSFLWALLVPALVVSAGNALGVDRFPHRLEETPEPGKVVLPERIPPRIKEDIVKTFQWRFNEMDHTHTVTIRRSVYEELKARERLPVDRWCEEYVISGITGEIRELALQLNRKHKMSMTGGSYQEVSFILAFIQQAIQYAKEEGEYPKYPLETLADGAEDRGEGDCEDFSILGAAILKCLGYEVALMLLPGHAALGVAGVEGIPGVSVEHAEFHYYYCEMTEEGWKFGDLPEEYSPSQIRVSPVPPLPVKLVRLEGEQDPAPEV